MKKLSLQSAILIVSALMILLLPIFFPLTPLRSPIESRLGSSLRGKVQIESVRLDYFPAPAITLNQLSIDSTQEASIDQVRIPISLRNLLSFGLALHDVHLSGVRLSQRFALSLPERLSADSYSLHLDRLLLDDLSIQLENARIGPLRAQLEFKEDGRIEGLDITFSDGKAQLHIQPIDTENYGIRFSAQHWALPFAYPVNFEHLSISGQASRRGLQISDIHGGLYNGLLSGSAELVWGDNWLLTGQIQARNLDAEALISVFSPVTRASGTLQGEGRFRFRAPDYRTLFDNPLLQGRFTIADGIVYNLDLTSPLKTSIPQTLAHGGQTRFDRLSGVLGMERGTVRLQRLQLEAGKFSAQGDLTVQAAGRIFGGTRVELGAGDIAASNQLTLSGTLAAPILQTGGAWRPSREETTDF